MIYFRAIDLQKAKAAEIGEVRNRSTGPHKKVSVGKWVPVRSAKAVSKQKSDATESARKHFDYALTTNLGNLVENGLQKHGIGSFEELVDYISKHDVSAAHKIFRTVVDSVRDTPATPKEKKAAIDFIGRSLISLRDTYATKPKTKLKVKVTSAKGKEYYKYPEGKHSEELPPIKPSVLASARKKMGGWSVTGDLTSSHVRKMISAGGAKLVSGKIDSKRKWVLPKRAADMELAYKGKDLTIRVRQEQRKRGAKRARTTAEVRIRIPYAYAKAYLQNQVASTRTRNNFIFRMEHSSGYRDFLERAAA